jgi:hypothetical protein
MGAAHGRGSSAHEQRRLSAECFFMLHLRSGIGGFRDCGHIRLLLKEIRDSARIGPARVQCPLQGRALYEASCGVSPVRITPGSGPGAGRAPLARSRATGISSGRGPLCRTGQVHFRAVRLPRPARAGRTTVAIQAEAHICAALHNDGTLTLKCFQEPWLGTSFERGRT